MDETLELLIEIKNLIQKLIDKRESQIINEVNVVDTNFTNGNEGKRGLLE
jgi:hypothetical protein